MPAGRGQRLEDQLDLGGDRSSGGLVKRGRRLVVEPGGIAGRQQVAPAVLRARINRRRTVATSRSQRPVALLRTARRSRGRSQRIVVAEPRRREERLERVKVGLADRVELVVVAARTADRQAQEDQARRLGDVVERVLPPQALVVQVDHVGITAIEAGGDEGRRIAGRDLVAGELQADEVRRRAGRG